MTKKISTWEFLVVTMAQWLNHWRILVLILTFLSLCLGIYAIAWSFKK